MLKNSEVREIAPDIPEGLELGLRNYWYPLLLSEALPADKPVGITALGEALVAFRDATGKPNVLRDRCPHRGVKLSVGRILDGQLQCILHGIRFDGEGRCALIPWEPEDSPLRREVNIAAYPAEELGGYVWAYLSDGSDRPVPKLASEVPEELSDDENFVRFRLPVETWYANWLLAIDGGDAFHAVTLHATTQAVANKTWEKGKAQEAEVPLNERRVKIVDTPHGYRGISVDRQGKPIHHGHFTEDLKGDRFVAPGLTTTPIMPAPGALPYASRLWQFPIDARSTLVQRFLAWRVKKPEDRTRIEQIYNDIALPRLLAIAAEDRIVAEAQGELVAARSDEYLFKPDRDAVRIRRYLKDAFLAQRDGGRVPVRQEGMVFPV